MSWWLALPWYVSTGLVVAAFAVVLGWGAAGWAIARERKRQITELEWEHSLLQSTVTGRDEIIKQQKTLLHACEEQRWAQMLKG